LVHRVLYRLPLQQCLLPCPWLRLNKES
jgi:hypothetical protein